MEKDYSKLPDNSQYYTEAGLRKWQETQARIADSLKIMTEIASQTSGRKARILSMATERAANRIEDPLTRKRILLELAKIPVPESPYNKAA